MLRAEFIGKVMQQPTFCTKKLQKFSSMKIEAHMVFHAVTKNFYHCLFSLHLLDATVSTASSTSTTTAPPQCIPDGEFYSKFGNSYSLALVCCCSYHLFDPSYLHKFANNFLEIVVLFSIDDCANLVSECFECKVLQAKCATCS